MITNKTHCYELLKDVERDITNFRIYYYVDWLNAVVLL